uniref:Putative salivary secreted protein n=1 Tax=Ixodes ricinus TaxID=34613 RepID=A0A147BEQ1_IXORI
MQLVTFVTLLLVPTVQHGVLSSVTDLVKNKCTDLIKEGGRIACNLTGQGDYTGMSIINCWVSCNDDFSTFFLPHKECQRILEVKSWAAFQEIVGSLPPYGFEDCSEEDQDRLQRWVNSWSDHREKAKKTLCLNGRNLL